MEQERNEVFERIPWETLEEKKGDRQWLLFGVAGAVVLGALAYSYMSSRPVAISTPTTIGATAASDAVTSAPAVPAPPAAPVVVSTAPMVTAEADLYAVPPERILDRVMAHAEWFVAEYLTVDGSEEGRAVLTSLMPSGVPLPTAPEGMRVFVEWVRAMSVEEIAPLEYRVSVLARSLSASGEEAYRRQPPIQLMVDISMAGEIPQVAAAPSVGPAAVGPSHELALGPVPDELGAAALEKSGGSEVVGGTEGHEGRWRVVVLAPGADGVTRPISVEVP
jgi:hypothetical protein